MTSTGPSPTVRYAMLTSPFRAYWVSECSTMTVLNAGRGRRCGTSPSPARIATPRRLQHLPQLADGVRTESCDRLPSLLDAPSAASPHLPRRTATHLADLVAPDGPLPRCRAR